MRLRPTGRGLGLAAAGVVAVGVGGAVGAVDLVRIGVLLILLLLGAVLGVRILDPARGRHRLLVERTTTPNPLHAGSSALVTVSVRATDQAGRARLAGLRLGEQASAELSEGRPLRARVARRPGQVSLTYPVLATRRGRWALGPLVVTRSDPFGVARATASLGEGTRISVWPAVTDLPIARGVLVGEPDRVALGARTPSTDDASLRDYRFGDDLRRVHWATSARRGDLMVRSDERAGLRPVTVLLDLDTRAESLEWSISLATSIALAMLEAGHPTRLLCGPPAVGVGPGGVVPDAAVRHGHVRPSGTARADLLDRTVDLVPTESAAAAEEDLISSAQLIASSEGTRELVFAVLGAMTPRVRAALAHTAATAQCWAVVRTDQGPPAQRAEAQHAIGSLHRAGWRVCAAGTDDDLLATWSRLLGSTA